MPANVIEVGNADVVGGAWLGVGLGVGPICLQVGKKGAAHGRHGS